MRRGLGALTVLVALAGCSGTATRPGTTPTPPAANSPSPVATDLGPCAASGTPPTATIAADFATALAFAPDGRLFWAERAGRIQVWQGGAAKTFASVGTVTVQPGGGYSERGLLGLAISPTFAKDRYVYALYSLPDYNGQRVVRWTDTDCAGTGTGVTTIVDRLPSGADCCHKGGRIAFGPDRMLYVTVGDNHQAAAAQDNCDLRGKVLRFQPDGSAAPGNLCGPVFATGVRNPFGLAIAPDGRVFITSNGPSGDAGSPGTGYDLAELIAPGSNNQWPVCYGYAHPLSGRACPAGSHTPEYSSEASTIVPGGATWVTAAGPYPERFVFCTYNGSRMKVFDGTRNLVDGQAGCALDVKQGPDNALYFSDAAHIYRFGGHE